jgi:DNA-binding response OmpR family regulator
LHVKKVLVVEGARPIEGLSGSLFKRRECTLMVASSGAEALSLSETDHPDLVLYDAGMTDLSPDDFVQALHSADADTPVIVVIDPEQSSREGHMLRAGASAVVVRPVDEIALNSKVCELLGISLRRHLRTFVKMKVDATVGAQTLFATISNISLGGVLVDCDRPMTMGDIIKLSFFLPGDDVPITVISKIVRMVGSTGNHYGCQFLDLSDSSRHRIHEFVTAAEGDA